MMNLIEYYSTDDSTVPFCEKSLKQVRARARGERTVQIIAYCLMLTHVHLVLKELNDGGISEFMSKVKNGYAKFFNARHNRKGPLWEGPFARVLVENDDQLIHVTRYIHLNPVTAYYVDDPAKWEYSSFNEYMGLSTNGMCDFNDLLDIEPGKYRKFVIERIDEQRALAKIKHLLDKEELKAYGVLGKNNLRGS
jgi:putative transposase